MAYRTISQLQLGLSNLQETAIKTQEHHGSWLKHDQNHEQRNHETMTINLEDHDARVRALLDRYGDIMGIVDCHPVFVKALAWGAHPQALTNRCKKHGVIAIMDAIRFVANRKSAICRSKLLFHIIDKQMTPDGTILYKS